MLTDKIKRVLEKSQFDLTNSILDVELQNLTLEYSYLSSPIEGIVTHISVPYAGVNILRPEPILSSKPKNYIFSVAAEQGDVINLKEGDVGDISFDAFPEKNSKLIYTIFPFLLKQAKQGRSMNYGLS